MNNIDSIASITERMKKISLYNNESEIGEEIESTRVNLWKARLHVEKLAISKLVYDLVYELLDSTLTEHALRCYLFVNIRTRTPAHTQ